MALWPVLMYTESVLLRSKAQLDQFLSFKPWRAEHTRAGVLGFEGVRDPGGVTVLGGQATRRVRWKLVLGSWWGGSEWEGKGPRGQGTWDMHHLFPRLTQSSS